MAQINTTVGDFASNEKKILETFRAARDQKAELVTFPELTLTGYPPEDLLFQRGFIDENLRLLKRILPQTSGLWAVIGFVDRDAKGRLYNAAAVLSNKKIVTVCHKSELPNYGVFDERRYFSQRASRKPLLVNIASVRTAITICEDIWVKNSFVYGPGLKHKTDLLVNISASPYHLGKQTERLSLVRNLAIHLKSPVIYQNLVGGQDELVFDGGSMAVDASGKALAVAERFKEERMLVEVPLTASGQTSKRVSVPRRLRCEEEVYQALVLGTKDYVQKCGFKKVLIGLSGGIDSALVARIAVDALGQENVIGVTLPSPYTSRGTYRDAKILSKRLGIQCLEFKISGLFDAYLGLLKKTFASYPKDITEENLQARIRGNILMALSNKWNALVLTTGNKSEMATGYCTLYGDMAGGFALIKDVPKTMVFQLAAYRNTLGPRNSIPEAILRRPPTAELRPRQTDQDTLPPYALLDPFLENFVENNASLDRIKVKGLSGHWLKRLAKMVNRSEYKRRQAPPGIKITPRAFGRDRRMPIVNHYVP